MDGRVKVPGAELFYRLQGEGPLLLFIQGGDGDASANAPLMEALATRYRVATFDPRGLSRSTIDGSPEGLTVTTHAQDVHHLLAALGDGPAIVCGCSRGAMVALELVARHPGQVRLLVAHEPPATQVLPPDERARAAADQAAVEQRAAAEGPMAAAQEFGRMLRMDFTDLEPGAVLPRPGPERAANFAFFLAHDAPAVRKHRFDLAALKAAQTRIVVGAGASSAGVFTHRCAVELARALDAPLATFPGGHAGATTHPRGFAAKLLEVLAAEA